MKAPSLLPKSALCLLLAAAWSGCDRAPKPGPEAPPPAAAATTPPPAATPPPPPPPKAAPVSPLVANAARFGMAGRMLKDTGLYLGSANFKAHREALLKTTYWKTLDAFLQDNKPTADKQKTMAEFEEYSVDEFFLAMGKDGAPGLSWLMDVNHLYSEYTYRTLITGFTGGAGKMGAFDPQSLLNNAATSPELIERMCALLERAELPPLLCGIKTAAPEKLMEKLFPAKVEAGPVWAANLKKGSLTTNTGAKLTTYEGTVGIWLTQAVRDEWLKGLGGTVKEPTLLERIKKTLDTLAAKKFSIAVGVMEGHLIAAAGNDLAHVQFAPTPAESLLARPDLAVAEPHASKDLLGLFHADANLLEAMHDDQPLTPMLQGALNGLAGTPVFSALTKQLEPKVAALTKAEKDFYRQQFTTTNGVLWWEKGVHMEVSGGVSPKGMILNLPLQFGALLDTPETLFAAVGHSPASVTGRAYFERWMDLIYTTAGGFIQAGLGGDQALGIYALADKGIIPPLVNLYSGSKTLYQKGLGTESAVVIDLKGQAPALPQAEAKPEKPAPGATPEESAPEVKPAKPVPWMPRIAAVYDLTDQSALAESWQVIEASLQEALKSLPLPLPAGAMTPISSDKNGITTWFYPLPFGGNDLLPCVSMSDKLFMFGTSKSLHEELAARLQKPGPAPALTGTHYRLSFAAVRGFLKNVNTTPIPGVPAESASAALPWIAPFGDARGRMWQEGEELRHSFHLEVNEPRKVD